jgi:DNA-binding CsgD family transcriptional regulator/tetratricopeptide (TPR) repeat protein/energy-coupling factor transporter ATP-binding protein EcfA2
VLEREHILAALAEYGRACQEGAGRLVLISGESGVGKSTLLEQFAHAMPDATWLRGGCDGLSPPRPLGPLFDIADQLGGDLLDAARRGAERDELFATLLRQLDRPGGLTVLALEDVHWADESTLDLLRFLGRRVRSVPVLVLATYRDDGLAPDGPLRLVLGDLASQRTTRRVNVAPLSEGAVASLAAGSEIEPAELYRLTAGNPFFVSEIMQATAGEVPPSARDAVLARVARLSADARHAVHAAALIGARVDPALLAAVVGVTPAVLDELVTSGVLVSDRAALRFRHEITRLAIEQDIPGHRLRPIHARVLAALVAAGCDDDAELAYHAEGADDRADVLHFAARAGRRASELAAHREAAAQYERALRFAAGEAPALVADLYDRLALEESLTDRWQQAADAREAALELWRQVGNRLREGDTLRRLSRTMWRLCRGREAGECATEAIATLEPLGPTPELAWAYTNLATCCMTEARFEAGIAAARRAERLAEQLDLPDALSDALDSEACMLVYAGGDWESTMHRALDVALRAGAAEQAGRAYSNMYEIYAATKRFAEAERYYVDGAAYCDDHDIATFLICLRGHRAVALVSDGRWDEAVALGCSLLASGAASPVNRLSPLLGVGTVLARRGDESAWVLLDEAVELALGTNEPEWISTAHLARAEAYWLAGRITEAAAEVVAGYPHALRSDDWTRGALAGWLHRTGVDLPVPADPIAEPYTHSVAGEYLAAERAWTALGCPYDAALALLDSGTDAGLREAFQRFESMGAPAAAQTVRREMRRLGLRSIPTGARASTRSNPFGLTRRECEVLDLVCSGHTNGEIADQLFIAVKTVDHHVSAVLAKLGAPTRRAAAAEAQRLGLVGTGG